MYSSGFSSQNRNTSQSFDPSFNSNSKYPYADGLSSNSTKNEADNLANNYTNAQKMFNTSNSNFQMNQYNNNQQSTNYQNKNFDNQVAQNNNQQRYQANQLGSQGNRQVYQPNDSQSPNYQNQNQKTNFQIPQSSIVKKYKLSQLNELINNHNNQIPEKFKKQWEEVKSYGQWTRSFTIGPIITIWAYTFFNKKKLWFKLTANQRILRFNIIYLTFVLFATGSLQSQSSRRLISQNLPLIQSLILKQEKGKKTTFVN